MFQHDNDPKHTQKRLQWIKQGDTKLLEKTYKIPNLNPFINL